MPDPQARYCTTEDGVRIAYRVEGDGPALVVIPLFIESFSLIDRMIPEHREFMRQLGEGRQIIRYDMRGTGLSQRQVDDVSHLALVRDVEAVVRAAGIRRHDLWASTDGGPRAIEYAARHPRQTRRLILYGTYARLADVFTPDRLQALAMLSRTDWDMAAQVMGDMSGREDFPDFGARYAAVYRESASGEVVARILEEADADVTGMLPKVKAPTLVVHRLHDNIYPFACGRQLAAGIPTAQFLPLEGRAHNVVLLDSQAILDAMKDFLGQADALPAPIDATETVGTFRTVLFTDVVGHTEMMSRLGDEKGREVLREHERITREALRAHGGSEVKTMGDGFMASFSSVTRAVECAIALQRAFAEPEGEPLSIRIGLNAGEPIEEEGDLFGAAVILAARIAAKAEGGEILASDVVRGLCAGKGFLFADTGEVTIKGFEEPVRLFAVRWSD